MYMHVYIVEELHVIFAIDVSIKKFPKSSIFEVSHFVSVMPQNCLPDFYYKLFLFTHTYMYHVLSTISLSLPLPPPSLSLSLFL